MKSISLQVQGQPREVPGRLIELSEGGCRVQTGVELGYAGYVGFSIANPAGKVFHLVGRVVSTTRVDPFTIESAIAFQRGTVPAARPPAAPGPAVAPSQPGAIATRPASAEARPADVRTPEARPADARPTAAASPAPRFPVTIFLAADDRRIRVTGQGIEGGADVLQLSVPLTLAPQTPLQLRFRPPGSSTVVVAGRVREHSGKPGPLVEHLVDLIRSPDAGY